MLDNIIFILKNKKFSVIVLIILEIFLKNKKFSVIVLIFTYF